MMSPKNVYLKCEAVACTYGEDAVLGSLVVANLLHWGQAEVVACIDNDVGELVAQANGYGEAHALHCVVELLAYLLGLCRGKLAVVVFGVFGHGVF